MHSQQQKPVLHLANASNANQSRHSQPQQNRTLLLPHRQISSSAATNAHNMAKFFIQRDFSEGVAVRFCEDYPNQLRGRVDADRFITVMRRINDYYEKAESISLQSFLENVFGCLTAYFIFMCIPTQYERFARKASDFIEDANKRLFHPNGVHMGDPMAKGLRCIEITLTND
ncbi:hypothetical protein ACOME3_008144 [Neoechinorhynchus agilis]